MGAPPTGGTGAYLPDTALTSQKPFPRKFLKPKGTHPEIFLASRGTRAEIFWAKKTDYTAVIDRCSSRWSLFVWSLVALWAAGIPPPLF